MSVNITLTNITDELPELYARCVFVNNGEAFTGYMSESDADLTKNVIMIDGNDVPIPIESFLNLFYIETTYLPK